MRTVADQVQERFVHPMEVDHLRSLVKPSLEESKDIKSGRPSFDELLLKTNELLENPSGAGLEVPSWLIALEEEIELLRYQITSSDEKRFARSDPSNQTILRRTTTTTHMVARATIVLLRIQQSSVNRVTTGDKATSCHLLITPLRSGIVFRPAIAIGPDLQT